MSPNLVTQPSVPYAPVPVPIAGSSLVSHMPSMQKYEPAVHNTNDQVVQARGSHGSNLGSYYFNGEPVAWNGAPPQSGSGAGHP